MNKRKLFTAVLALASVCAGIAKTYEPVDYVNTLVGSESKHSLSTGNTYPAVAMPWGMNFWTPQTGKMGDGWTYTYSADKLRGFKQTHQPSPWINDYGQFAVMPEVGAPVFDEEKARVVVLAQGRGGYTLLLSCLPCRLRCRYRDCAHGACCHYARYLSRS